LSASVDILDPDRPKRIAIVASNPAVSEQTGWPIGFRWAELSHPSLEPTERGYKAERFADDFVGQKIQPFWIEDEARKLDNTNYIVSGRFKPHAVRDGNLITGQQQYSGREAAKLIVEALGQ
jgi:putative intracellular protease/amidase